MCQNPTLPPHTNNVVFESYFVCSMLKYGAKYVYVPVCTALDVCHFNMMHGSLLLYTPEEIMSTVP